FFLQYNNISVPVRIGDLHWSLASLSESAFEKGNGCLSRTSLSFNHLLGPHPSPGEVLLQLWTWIGVQLFRQFMQLKPRENLRE
uniref:Uncharacterized protein n=1 Tax=Monodon monoceros TaxID=40151 RepID=A0A8C6ALI4_MONMO